jgi:sialidase-1
MAVWRSTTGGQTFVKAATLSTRPAAYSDLVQLGATRVGILYETGVTGPYESVEFRRLPVSGPLG